MESSDSQALLFGCYIRSRALSEYSFNGPDWPRLGLALLQCLERVRLVMKGGVVVRNSCVGDPACYDSANVSCVIDAGANMKRTLPSCATATAPLAGFTASGWSKVLCA